MKKYNLYLILTVLLLSKQLYSQSDEFVTYPNVASQEVMQNITSTMTNKYDGSYYMGSYFSMDLLVNKSESPDWTIYITDPYGTLNGVSIFSCGKAGSGWARDSTIIGLYKDNKVVWDSGPIIYGSITSYLAFSKDINKNGKVDIGIESEYIPEYPRAEAQYYLWIISWDGQTGEIINDYDINTDKSKIIHGPFDLLDENGDGIYEIESDSSIYADDTHPVTYGWNGSKYGLWPSVRQLKWGDYYPAIWIKPTIHCKVSKDNELLKFEYMIENDSSSVQSINRTYISELPISDITKSSKRGSFASLEDAWLFRAYNQKSIVNPGEIQKGYWYAGNGLPGICTAYLQGLTYGTEITTNFTEDDYKKKRMQNNSVIKKTIGLKLIPLELDSLAFIDTLITYTDSSYALGWIKDEQTRDKYDNYFNTAKTYLEQNNNNAAKAELKNVLTDCNTDSSSVLTSEAYALLYFNTDYLIKQIPEGEPGLPVKLEDSQGNLLQGGSLKFYDSGWKDATDNGDGTFTVQTGKNTVSIKMHYAGGSINKDQDIGEDPLVVFQTVNSKVQLKD